MHTAGGCAAPAANDAAELPLNFTILRQSDWQPQCPKGSNAAQQNFPWATHTRTPSHGRKTGHGILQAAALLLPPVMQQHRLMLVHVAVAEAHR